MNQRRRTIFPSLRGEMGNWTYYVTYMSFSDIAQLVKRTDEVHKSERLAEWIQRQLDENRASAIAKYLTSQEERFFNALVLGIYDGEPRWAPLDVASSPQNKRFELSEEEQADLQRGLGLLSLSGTEKIFAIDGQHRVAGIKRALKDAPGLGDDEICAVFVGHQPAKIERTRRLFTTLNKKAERVKEADIIALDEDNGFAIITRNLVDDFDLFAQGHFLSFSGSADIKENQRTAVTSVINLCRVAKDVAAGDNSFNLSGFENRRPRDDQLRRMTAIQQEYWTALATHVPEYRSVLLERTVEADEYRRPNKNHLLFRPAGQRAFAAATACLVRRDRHSLPDAVKRLASVDLWIHNREWAYVLWDPHAGKMRTTARNRCLATSHVLVAIGSQPRSAKESAVYKQFLQDREDGKLGVW